MIPYIDIHCHLDFPQIYPRIDETIKNAIKNDVRVIISNGVDRKTNRLTLALSEKYEEVKAALGFYPPDTQSTENEFSFNKQQFNEELDFIKNNKSKIHALG